MLDGGLRQLFRDNLPMFHWQSIETALTGRGVPDSNYCFEGAEGWVEFKHTAEWAVTLRPEQVGWLCQRARAGGRVTIAVRRQCTSGPRRPACDDLYLVEGGAAREAKAAGLRGLPPGALLAQFSKPWSWDEVGRVLRRSTHRAAS